MSFVSFLIGFVTGFLSFMILLRWAMKQWDYILAPKKMFKKK